MQLARHSAQRRGTTTTTWGGRPRAGLNHKWTKIYQEPLQHQHQLQPQLETSEKNTVFNTNEKVNKPYCQVID